MRKIFMALLGVILLLSLIEPIYTKNIGEAAVNDGESMKTAIPVTVPTVLQGGLKDYNYRYYKVTIPSDGELAVSMANPDDSIYLSVKDSQEDKLLYYLD